MSADRLESAVPLAEIAQGPSPFDQFLDKNQKLLVALAILIVIAAAGLVVYRGVEKSRQLTAGAELLGADELSELQKIIETHPDTRAAHSAVVLLAEQQWSSGQQDAAIQSLRDFVDSNPDHPALASARASLASKLMTQGKTGDATAVFQSIIDDTRSRYLAPYALICLGDLAKVAGETDKAETLYSRARNDFSGSRFSNAAAERLAALKASPPVEVDPPVPAEPAPAEPAPQEDETATGALPTIEVVPQSPPATGGETTTTPPVEVPPTPETAPATPGDEQAAEAPEAATEP